MDPGLSWGFLGLGFFAQAFALGLALRPVRLLRAGGRARGTVLETEGEMVAGKHGASRAMYFPLVEFATARGQIIIFSSRFGTMRKRPAGTQVGVIYDPELPREAEIAAFGPLWLFPVLTSVFSMPFLVVGLLGTLHKL